MSTENVFLRTALTGLPKEAASKIRALCGSSTDSSVESALDTLIRFVIGADSGLNASADTKTQWSAQRTTMDSLRGLFKHESPSSPSTSGKRLREDDNLTDEMASKKQKPTLIHDATSDIAQDPAVFALQSVSASSPVRKKVNILVHKHSIRLINPTSNAIETSISLSTLTRAFLVPTRGKTKAHWTVVILPNDTADRGNKQANASAANQQIIFGVDATTATPLIVTDHTTSSPTSTTLPKGSETYSTLQAVLSHLGAQIIEPKPSVFKSACSGITSGVSASEDGIPGVEAYRGAKVGSLWFSREGILWGESKPCEFWAVEELIPKSEAVRVVGGASGQRTLTVVLTRKNAESSEEDGEDGIESEFGMVDARERLGIEGWTRAHRHLFGKKQAPTSKASGPAAAGMMNVDEEDEEDEDFEPASESDGGSATSDSDEEGDGDSDGDEEDAEGSDDEEEDEVEELKPEHHPLLQPGAMPKKMSRGVIDMVASMVEGDLMDSSDPPLSEQPDDEDMEDELDD